MVAAACETDSKADAALEEFCRDYWYPLYAYVRRSGQPPHDAQDLTQEFFRQLIEKRWLEDADRGKGKLRTFLIVALKHFMAKEWRRATAQRRDGAAAHTSFDTDFAESRFAADHQSLGPEETYDRQWALILLDRTMNRLRDEFAAEARPGQFETMKDCLLADRGGIDYAVLARKLDSNEGAARVAVHRMRKRFRSFYREEIARTLEDGADVEEEMRHLAAALVAR